MAATSRSRGNGVHGLCYQSSWSHSQPASDIAEALIDLTHSSERIFALLYNPGSGSVDLDSFLRVIDKDINKRSVVDNYEVRGKLQNHENFTTSTVATEAEQSLSSNASART